MARLRLRAPVGAAWNDWRVTDGTGGWTSPSGDGRDDGGLPRFGERAPDWAASAPSPAAPPPNRYVRPPRRGLIPLHPLSFGQLLGASFGVIRWNAKATIVPALLIGLLQSGLLLGGAAAFAFSAIDRVQRAANETDRAQILAGVVGGGIAISLVAVVITVFTSALLQGMLVTVVARAALGERIGIRQALRAALKRVLPLIAVALLLGVLQIVALGVLALLVFAIAQAGDTGVVLAVLTGVVGGLLLVVAYAFFAVKLTTVPSTIVLEGLGVFASIRRSWVLVRGAFWRTFGLLALVIVMVSAASQLVTLPFSVLGGAIGGLLFPNAGSDSADLQASVVPLLISTVPGSIVAVLVAGIGQVAQVAAVVLVYLDRRMRREGLDLELQRFVEEGGADPFERVG